jgi:hypothetical protein
MVAEMAVMKMISSSTTRRRMPATMRFLRWRWRRQQQQQQQQQQNQQNQQNQQKISRRSALRTAARVYF